MDIVIKVIGGLGLFLYGMNLMGTGLQKAAGDKLKNFIEVLTKNRFTAVLVGTGATLVIQSSSAVTVMIVGFVNAGIMNLNQAIGVIMGANLGTTITAQLIAFKLTDIAPLAIGIGVALKVLPLKQKTKEIADILIGFGILFMGMDTMSGALEPLSQSDKFKMILMNLKNPFIGIIVGFLMTTLVQSSSASIGLLLALASQNLLTIEMALPVLYGDNIGTTTTAMISSIGANRTAKQAAFMHMLFNLIGTILFILVFNKPVSMIVEAISPNSVTRQVANAHTLFNLINVIVQFPFANLIVKAAEKVIKSNEEEEKLLKYIDNRLIEAPSVAISQAYKEVVEMGSKALKNLNKAAESFYNKDEKLTQKVFEKEKEINKLEKEITKFLVKLDGLDLTKEEQAKTIILFHSINDIERIGDHAENIAELTDERIDENLEISNVAMDELKLMFNKTIDLYTDSLLALETSDKIIAKEVLNKEDELDKLEKEYRESHIQRLNKRECNPSSGIVYLDIISNLERIGDHSVNIAYYVIDTFKE